MIKITEKNKNNNRHNTVRPLSSPGTDQIMFPTCRVHFRGFLPCFMWLRILEMIPHGLRSASPFESERITNTIHVF